MTSTHLTLLPATNRLSFSVRRRLEILLQSQTGECGLACITMIANYHQHLTDLFTLRHRYPNHAQGMNLQDVLQVAASLNLAGRAMRLELEQLHELSLPCILHWDLDHFVVLKQVKRRGVWIHDPAQGERWVDLKTLNTAFTGIALELTPTVPQSAQQPVAKTTLASLFPDTKVLLPGLGIMAVLSLILQALAIVSPLYLQWVVDDVLVFADVGWLKALTLGFVLLLLIELLTRYVRQRVVLRMSSQIGVLLSQRVFIHLVHLPLSFFHTRHLGDIMSRFQSLHQVRDWLAQGVVTVIVDGLLAITTLFVMWQYAPTLTACVIFSSLLYLLVRLLTFARFRRTSEQQLNAQASEQTHFMETLRSMQAIKLFGLEVQRQNDWVNRWVNATNEQIRLGLFNLWFDTSYGLLSGLTNVLVIFLGASAVLQGQLSVGMLFAFVAYKQRFTHASEGLIQQWLTFLMLRLHFERLADILSTPHEAIGEQAAAGVPCDGRATPGGLCVRALTFCYPGATSPLLDQLSFDIEPGQTIAITGTSGCGKSTLLKCLLGLLRQDSGDILFNGTDIRQQPGYRQRVAAVLQDDTLLSGSVLENIGFGETTIDIERAHECARLAQIEQDILTMPLGYHTLIGDLGSHLSGGQKQRLLLARALYRKPDILFLDEATSHLDIGCENHINSLVATLSMTRVIIAHRPHSLALAQRILRLENGRLTDVTQVVKNAVPQPSLTQG
ncbi:peptidase domain-containing ABC transporter [Aestuariibacter halophilus]|uniref:Peptidase domain-containing ABC transporter n=1 Tax=Fluctibacter halophilus TaxID=226011 RepID=A0ABS8GCG2_9ALTE|nr:peptidase domain-containing ABC transporter [Aestuariibacter halophilus]MCC2618222.1 peptidase domain-containing ABC transporter [Aestuariibacter halophilus]